jgi:BlaI family transcriptional regulator, penicillinase repressor
VTFRSSGSKPLTALQQAILDCIWATETATAEQVREAIKREHPLKESSVRTVLSRLEVGGYLRHAVAGKTFVYRATAPRKRIAARAIRHIIDRFCAGSVEQFLTGMVEEDVLSVDELDRLARKVRNGK